MHLFHKWGKWSEVKQAEWIRTTRSNIGFIVSGPTKYLREFQERYCLDCGKYERKYLN